MAKVFKFFGKLTKSKRFWFAFIVFLVDMVAFVLGVKWGSDPIALGTGITMISAPLFVYIIGETVRPSGILKTNETYHQNKTTDNIG